MSLGKWEKVKNNKNRNTYTPSHIDLWLILSTDRRKQLLKPFVWFSTCSTTTM